MRILDLFCGAGGAAMGYYRAGFEVVGVDMAPQPSYPFEFHQADALTFPLDDFDAIHASPPCQAYSVTRVLWEREHPDLLPLVRQRLLASGKPFIIENVVGAPFLNYVQLCGSMFGLRVQRHRRFESNMILFAPGRCQHKGKPVMVAGHGASNKEGWKEAMGIDWTRNRYELAQAIPPAYTQWLGGQLFGMLERAA